MECGEISESEFAGRLHALGVETHGLSFGWMLNEYDAHGVLRWMFTHLGNDNALTARESCRYSELQKKGLLLHEEELEERVADLLREYPGLVLPGDASGLRRARQHNHFLRERLALLQKQEATLHELKKNNELAKEEVSRQVGELRECGGGGRGREREEEERCRSAAERVERRERDLFVAVAQNLDLYCNFQPGTEASKQFVAAGPLEAYTQNRRLFRSHFKLCASRRLDGGRWNEEAGSGANRDRAAATLAEKRLYNAICAYVESAIGLSASHKTLQTLSDYEDLHPSRVLIATTECMSRIELLKQDEQLARARLRASARELARQQTRRTLSARARAALQQRRELHGVVCSLHARALTCAALDSLLYLALRREWQRAEDTLRFATDVRRYLQAERVAVAARIDAMSSLYREHTECEERLRTGNLLLSTLNELYGDAEGGSSAALAQKIDAMRSRTAELKEEMESEFRRKEQFLDDILVTSEPLIGAVYDGCTRRANARDRDLDKLLARLRADTSCVEDKVARAVDAFTAMKSKDKDVRRKMWQWFLTDPERLLAKMEEVRRQVAR